MILRFNKIQDKDMKEYLEQNYNMKNITQNSLEMYQGSIGKAIYLKDKEDIYQNVEKLVDQLSTDNLIDIVNKAEVLYKEKEEIYEMLDYINVLLLKKAKEDYKYANCIEIVENAKKRLKQNVNYDMSIDGMLFNIYEQLA